MYHFNNIFVFINFTMIRFRYAVFAILIWAFSFTGNAQVANYPQYDISEGNIRITFITSQIFRIQQSLERNFNVLQLPDSLRNNVSVDVLRVEDRLRIESDLFTLEYIPGMKNDENPSIVSRVTHEEIYPLSQQAPLSYGGNNGVLVLENSHGEFFPSTIPVASDRLVLISPNNFIAAQNLLKSLTGTNPLSERNKCHEPQVFFRPADGKAIMTISGGEGQTIHYTVDGTIPDFTSSVYNNPDTINYSVRVNAFAEGVNCMPSAIATAQIVMSKARSIQWRYPTSPDFKGFGEFALMDGVKGNRDDFTHGWIGIPQHDAVATVELNRKMNLCMLGISFFQQSDTGIFLPNRVIIEVSRDGRRFHQVYRQRIKNVDSPYPVWTHNIIARFRSREITYIRITATQNADNTLTNKALQGKGWIFMDELRYEESGKK